MVSLKISSKLLSVTEETILQKWHRTEVTAVTTATMACHGRPTNSRHCQVGLLNIASRYPIPAGCAGWLVYPRALSGLWCVNRLPRSCFFAVVYNLTLWLSAAIYCVLIFILLFMFICLFFIFAFLRSMKHTDLLLSKKMCCINTAHALS